MKLTKTFAAILGAGELLLLLFLGVAVAQGQGPRVISIDPTSVREGKEATLTISGIGFTSPVTMTLSTATAEVFLESRLVSSTTITANLVGELKVGSYKLCVCFADLRDCTDFEVSPALNPQITTITPTLVYNTEDRSLTILGVDLTEPLTVTLGNQPLQDVILSVSDAVSKEVDLKVTIPISFTPGEYRVHVALANGQQIQSEDFVDVKGPINPAVESVVPERVLRFPQNDIPLRARGKHLELLDSAQVGYYDCVKHQYACELLGVSDSEIKLRYFARTVRYDEVLGDFGDLVLDFCSDITRLHSTLATKYSRQGSCQHCQQMIT